MRARDGESLMLCVILCATSITMVSGQEKKEPPPRRVVLPADSVSPAMNTKLPKIELPEFVITGKEAIDLPEVSKTPVDDQVVNTPLRVAATPGKREPGFTDFGGIQKSQAGFSDLGNGYNGKAEVGYGTYATPYFDAWFGNSYPSADFLLKAGYRSSGGHVSNADFRVGYASLAGGTHLSGDAGDFSGNRVQGRIAMRGNSYHLYGSTTPALQRTVTDFDAGLSMSSSSGAMIPYTAKLALESGSLKDVSKTMETSLGGELDATHEIDDVELRGSAALWKSFYSAQSATAGPFYTQFAGTASYRLGTSVSIRGGLSFYLYRGSDTRTSGRLYPQLGISWYAAERLTVYAKFDPSIQRTSLASMAGISPYMATDVSLRHAVQFTNFSLGAESEISPKIQSRVSLNYTQTDDVPVFVDLNSARIWDVIYLGTTRIVSLNGELYANLTNADNLGASLAVRSNRNSETGNRNPYFASFLSSVSYQHRFEFGLSLGSTLQIVGSQSADLADTRALPAFVVFNVSAEYVIIPRWRAMLTLSDIFNQRQTLWEGYAGLQRTVSIGTSFVW